MRLLATRLTAIASAVKRLFSPASLFRNSEQGLWYDPSDLSTLFQDSAGTTPVTAVEQPVGKILDKSGRGNHATQATSASRPVLSARVNLLTKSEDFSDAVWAKFNTTITPNAEVGPDGTMTADKIVVSASTDQTSVSQTPSGTVAASYTYREILKQGEKRYAGLVSYDGTSYFMASVFDLETGTVSKTFAGSATCVKDAATGWCTCTVNGSSVGALVSNFTGTRIYDTGTPAAISTACTGNGLDGLYAWGASLVYANQSSLPYQRVNTATDYDTVGFPHYLKFDGVDDSLATASINFTSTDKMTVFAGVRKLSDTATGAVVEFDITTNIGSFGLFAPYGAAANYSFRSQGTVQSVNTVAGFTSPITNVITCLGDIAGDSNIFRANGVATALGSDQGTGNFSNKILYIGRRAGTSVPFKGHIYSLIIRGAQSTDSQIVSAESYVNSKTGAY